MNLYGSRPDEMISWGMAGAALMAAGANAVAARYSKVRMIDSVERGCTQLREEIARGDAENAQLVGRVREDMETAEKNAQANLELLRDGRMGIPARARALGLLRTGMAAETAAAELGMARNDVRLLAKVSMILAPRD